MRRLAILILFALPLSAQTVHIACGRPYPYTDSSGQVWQADTDFNIGYPYGTDTAVTGTPDSKLFQYGRYSKTDAPALTYTIPLPNGNYTLSLYFAETYLPAATTRVFNVKANGTPILSNFNIASDAGGTFKADIKSFTVTVSTGNLIIEFLHIAGTPENPAIAAIAVGPPPPFVLTLPGLTNLTFLLSDPAQFPVCTPAEGACSLSVAVCFTDSGQCATGVKGSVAIVKTTSSSTTSTTVIQASP